MDSTSRLRRIGWIGCLCSLLGLLQAPLQATAAPPPPRADHAPPQGAAAGAGEIIYEGGLQEGWEDWGWAPRDTEGGHAARLNFANYAGWTLVHRRGPLRNVEAVTFTLAAPPSFGQFLEIRVAAATDDSFPRVRLEDRHLSPGKNGEIWARVSLAELNPRKLPFDRLTLHAHAAVTAAWVEIDHYGLSFAAAAAPGDASTFADFSDEAPRRLNTVSIDCSQLGKEISPLIYGIAYDPRGTDPALWELYPSGRRWGGTPTSRYNWKLGNAWNTAGDWFFSNINYAPQVGYSWRDFLNENRGHHVKAAITLPMLGWVARDRRSYSFPVSSLGPQHAVAPPNPDIGDGLSPDGVPLDAGDPRRTSVAATPEFVADWVQAIAGHDAGGGRKQVAMYILDNQPALWHVSHRDVHPLPVTYDELLSRTLAYGSAIRRADPGAVIAGPAAWGWPEYFFSGQDARVGLDKKPDRLMHEDKELLAWYLGQLKAYEQRTGTRLLNVLDVHYFPQSSGVLGDDEKDDEATAARRLRATRSLWDLGYVDESWIDDRIYLLPRLKALIAQNYPGTQISLGEYHFGGEKSVSGALAQAAALGQFASQGIYAAYLSMPPTRNSSTYWGFAAYRNYDGKGAHFGDRLLQSVGDRQATVFASRDPKSNRIVLVALNLDPRTLGDTTLQFTGCRGLKKPRAFRYAASSKQQLAALDGKQLHPVGSNALRLEMPPYSLSVVEVLCGR